MGSVTKVCVNVTSKDVDLVTETSYCFKASLVENVVSIHHLVLELSTKFVHFKRIF